MTRTLPTAGATVTRRGVRVALPPAGLAIGGSPVAAASGAVLEVAEPATGEHLATVAAAGAEDVDAAVSAARRAYTDEWAPAGPDERAGLLHRVAALIDAHRDELAILESANTGKPLRDTREGDVLEAAAWFRSFASAGAHLRSSVVPALPGHHVFTSHEPYGVVGLVVPWNYPLVCAATKLAPALAAGNCVVLKPSELTPLSALALAEICTEVGIPGGVVNVLPGTGPVAGRALVEHPGVGMLSFTGSTAAGRDVLARAAARAGPVAVELGGKSPNIVFADADIEQAVATALFSVCTNAGQLCTAGTRLLVQREVRDDVVDALVAGARALTVGDPWQPDTQVGPLISERQHERVAGYVERGIADGARLLTGGGRVDVAGCVGGFYREPTIFDRVDPDATIAREEIFGPVLSIIEFRDEAEAIRLANRTLYGLAAGVWTRDLGRALRMSRAVEAGIVYVNTMHAGSPDVPVGGWKDSGYGLEGGIEQALGFTRHKTVVLNVDASAPAL